MSKTKKFIILSILFFITVSFKSDKPAYRIFDHQGKATRYNKVLKSLSEADVVFLGEQHNNPVIHWLQYELTKDLFEADSNMTLGAEMFEADNQILLDEYLSGLISESKFEDETRLWDNYQTDYKPLVAFANENNLPFIATNIPRRYASRVFSGGLESLKQISETGRAYIAPLPIKFDSTLNCYAGMLKMGHGNMGGAMSSNFPKSQAIKDATMAWFISQNIPENGVFIHYNGAYHSDNHEGIVWYLNRYKPGLKIMVISSGEQGDISDLDPDNNKGDFNIIVPSTMTKTY